MRKRFKKAKKDFSFRLKNRGKTEILVLGDSHAAVFSCPDAAPRGYYYQVKDVGGVTISGLQNPNSVTKALPIFEEAIQHY